MDYGQPFEALQISEPEEKIHAQTEITLDESQASQQTPVHLAIINHHEEVVEAFIKHKGNGSRSGHGAGSRGCKSQEKSMVVTGRASDLKGVMTWSIVYVLSELCSPFLRGGNSAFIAAIASGLCPHTEYRSLE